MKFKELDTVVLNCDLPEQGLRRGDLGVVVQVYEPDGLEVEFVTVAGRTQALVTLKKQTYVRRRCGTKISSRFVRSRGALRDSESLTLSLSASAI